MTDQEKRAMDNFLYICAPINRWALMSRSEEEIIWKRMRLSPMTIGLLALCYGAFVFSMKKLSQEIINERLRGTGYEMIGPYITNKRKTLFACNKGHRWEAQPNTLLAGFGCPGCARNSPEIAREDFLRTLHGSGYVAIEQYRISSKKIKILCPEGHYFKMPPNNFKQGQRCPICCQSGYKTHLPAVFYVYELSRYGATGLGFGISNAFHTRRLVHNNTFRKTNTQAVLIAKVHYQSGLDALNVETALKRHPAIMNFGIKGFQKECFPVAYKSFLLQKIMMPTIPFST